MNERQTKNYGMRRFITDDMVRLSDRGVLGYLEEDLRRAFDRLKEEQGLPEGAKPLWCVSWEYEDDGERP